MTRTAEGITSQETSGTPEAKAEQRVDKKDGDGATRSEDYTDQATDRKAYVGNGRRVESGMLQIGADRSIGAEEED